MHRNCYVHFCTADVVDAAATTAATASFSFSHTRFTVDEDFYNNKRMTFAISIRRSSYVPSVGHNQTNEQNALSIHGRCVFVCSCV